MIPIIKILIPALLPVIVMYIFYSRYFSIRPSYLSHLQYFLMGAALASLILLVDSVLPDLIKFDNPTATAFFKAAFVEKFSMYILVFIILWKFMKGVMIPSGIIMSMLMGIGFSTFENILYALTYNESIVVVRLISSVPLHVLSTGLIGYYLGTARLYGAVFKKIIQILKAFIIPFLFHAFFDAFMMLGGKGIYLIAPLLVLLIIVMEYTIAKSLNLPLPDGLKEHDVSLEDWVTIQREPQFERWILKSMGSTNKEIAPLFIFNLGIYKILAIVFMLSTAFTAYFNSDFILKIIDVQLSSIYITMLFIFLPVLYSLDLLIIGIINPRFFQNSIIKIPIIIEVKLSISDIQSKTFTYHITTRNCYLKTVEPVDQGKKVLVKFHCGNFSSPEVAGVAAWDSLLRNEQFGGTLIRFTHKPAGFYFFLIKYYKYRILRGLSYNLKLPGFKEIRQLFVHPASVMQKKYKFDAGHVIFKQGDTGTDFYLIRKGIVDIIKTFENGEKLLLTTLYEGDILGEMAITGNQERLADAVCRTDCLVAISEAYNLDALIDSNPVFTQKLIKNFANRLHSSEKMMSEKISSINESVKSRELMLAAVIKKLLLHSETENENDYQTALENIKNELNISEEDFQKIISILKQG